MRQQLSVWDFAVNVVQGGAGGYAAPLAATYRPLMDQGAPRTPRDAAPSPSPSPIEMSFEVLPGSSPDPAPRPGLLDRSRDLAGRFGARRRPAPSDPGASEPSPPGDPGPPARSLRSRTLLGAGAALVVVLLGVWWWLARDPGPPQITRSDVTAAIDEGIARAQEEARAQPPDAATAFRTIQPSLVVITTQLTGGASPAPTPAPTRGASGLGAGTVVTLLRRSRTKLPRISTPVTFSRTLSPAMRR